MHIRWMTNYNSTIVHAELLGALPFSESFMFWPTPLYLDTHTGTVTLSLAFIKAKRSSLFSHLLKVIKMYLWKNDSVVRPLGTIPQSDNQGGLSWTSWAGHVTCLGLHIHWVSAEMPIAQACCEGNEMMQRRDKATQRPGAPSGLYYYWKMTLKSGLVLAIILRKVYIDYK